MNRRSFAARLAGALAALTAGLKADRPATKRWGLWTYDPPKPLIPHYVITDLGGSGLAGEDLVVGDVVTFGSDGRYYRASGQDPIGTIAQGAKAGQLARVRIASI